MSAHDSEPRTETRRRLAAGLLTLLLSLSTGAAAATAGSADAATADAPVADAAVADAATADAATADAAVARPRPDRSGKLILNHNETVLARA
ncbi:hypothetical protein ACFXJ8_22645 [Nonomuraea sp. NPDC059194]|uniref:hypothetical protein n=1 Tax=Nonomuraea sp. NPDC059194 TaxID=3346764 RepID=UPI0036C64EBE